MTEKVYRAAVIGLGRMGDLYDEAIASYPLAILPQAHTTIYQAHPRTQLVAGASRSRETLERFRRQRGVAAVYGDYQRLLREEQPDIVSIATQAPLHAEMVIAAAEAGVKGIYCEKAMATSLAECDAMIAACRKRGAVLIINHQRRWEARYRALKKIVDEGEIGPLQHISISFGRGRLCRGGSHMFDLALMFAGRQPQWGWGWLSNPDEVDPGGTGVFECARGLRIFIDGAMGMEHYFAARFIGTCGQLEMVNDGGHIVWWEQERGNQTRFWQSRQLPLDYPVKSPMLLALDDLVEAVETGRQPLSSGEDGRAAFEMITAVHLANARAGERLRFPLEERNYRILSQ